MKTPGDLFLLIRSMTKPEKGYFKKFTSIHVKGDKNNYIKLFDIIAAQEEPDEDEVEKKLKNNPISKYLSSAKVYLYKLVLKSLRSYYSDSSAEIKIIINLRNAEILKNKGLIKQSIKMLDAARQLAGDKEDFSFLLKINERFRKTLLNEPDLVDFSYVGKGINEENNATLEKIKELSAVDELYFNQLSLYYTYGHSLNTAVIAEFKEMLQHPLMQDQKKFLSREALRRILDIKSRIFIILKDYSNFIKTSKLYLDLIRSHPLFQTEMLPIYSNIFNNQMTAYFKLGKVAEAESCFKMIQQIKPPTHHEEIITFSFSYATLLDGYIQSGLIRKGIDLVPHVKEQLNRFKTKIPPDPRLIIDFSIARLYFIKGDYSEALKWNNKIINGAVKGLRADIYEVAVIINILIHYELKNFDLMQSLIASQQRTFSKQKTENGLLRTVLKNLKRIIPDNDLKKNLTVFQAEISEQISKEDTMYLLIVWIESKLQKKSMEEIIRKGAQ